MKEAVETCPATPPPVWLSPSLAAKSDGTLPAFEMKFAVPSARVPAIEAWATRHLLLDPHADPALNNGYRITSVYYDTPTFDVFHRRKGYCVDKYRVRRYGTSGTAHLERKSKQAGRVWKKREALPLADVPKGPGGWPVDWFVTELGERNLRPVCTVSYVRTAYIGSGPTGPVRLTLDRQAVGRLTNEVTLQPVETGVPLLTDELILELKFLSVLPTLFKDLIAEQTLAPTGLSKYRRCASATGLVPEGTSDA